MTESRFIWSGKKRKADESKMLKCHTHDDDSHRTFLSRGRNESRRQQIKWQMWYISVTEKLTLLMIVISDSVYKIKFPAANEIELSPWSQREFQCLLLIVVAVFVCLSHIKVLEKLFNWKSINHLARICCIICVQKQ